jgi:DHA1 family purine base/nucleoside efflux pump-like MFS transporter
MKIQLWLLALGNFAVGTGALIITGILPKVSTDLNVSVTVAGQLVTIYALTYAIAAPLLAAFTGNIARRIILLSALLIIAGANVVAAIAPNYEIVFIARLLAAFGGAIFTPVSLAVAVTIAPPAERGRAIALVFSGLPIANVLGIPFGTFIGSNFGWRISFWLVALFALLATAAMFVIIKSLPATPPIALKQWLGLLKQGRLVVVISITFWQYTAQFLAFTYIAPLLQKNTGLDGNGISLALLVFGAAGVAGNALGGRLADRFSLPLVLGIILSGITLNLFLLPLATNNLITTYLILIVWGICGFSFNPVQQSYLVSFVPQTPSLVLSLNSSMLYAGQAAGAAIGGGVVAAVSVQSIGWVGGIIAFIAIGALFLSLRLRNESKKANPASALNS